MIAKIDLSPFGGIKAAVRAHLESRGDVAGATVVDVPAGRGAQSAVLAALGARVEAYDLFPESFVAEGLTCRHADLTARLPVADGHADIVLCQEAIEHLPDPLHALCELNRILRPGGVLLLTTPNVSHLRARVSHLLLESDLYNRLPANELDAVWHADGGRRYFGHLFLIGVQRLRVLASLAGFGAMRALPTQVSVSSLLLAPLWPLLALATAFARHRTSRRLDGVEPSRRDAVLADIARLNLHPAVLFGKHLFVELHKKEEAAQVRPPVHKDPATIR